MSDVEDGCEKQLARAGVFKGHDGLRKFSKATEFWSSQPYGTRLYFGSGGLDYLHIGVLTAAVKALDDAERLERELAEAKAALAQMREASKRAIGTHNAPDDCYATGPMTGNDYVDLVQCPACELLKLLNIQEAS